MNLKEQRQWVLNELSSVADFWLKNGMDDVNGGVYTAGSTPGTDTAL